MEQWLRVLTGSLEDPGSVPSTPRWLTIAHHSKSRERIPLTSEGPSMHIVYINTWHTYIVNLIKKKIVGKLDMLEGCKVRSSKSSSAK